VGSIFYQIVLRYVFSAANAWSEELARYTFVWQVLLGAAVAVRKARHMQIDYFLNKFPPKVRMLIDISMKLVVLYFFFVIAQKGMDLYSFTQRQQSTGLAIPMSRIYLAIPVGAVLMIIFTVEEMMLKYLPGIRKETGGERSA
jgi:TRAP-type C4-dicarboxylate transport system permease small subunit